MRLPHRGRRASLSFSPRSCTASVVKKAAHEQKQEQEQQQRRATTDSWSWGMMVGASTGVRCGAVRCPGPWAERMECKWWNTSQTPRAAHALRPFGSCYLAAGRQRSSRVELPRCSGRLGRAAAKCLPDERTVQREQRAGKGIGSSGDRQSVSLAVALVLLRCVIHISYHSGRVPGYSLEFTTTRQRHFTWVVLCRTSEKDLLSFRIAGTSASVLIYRSSNSASQLNCFWPQPIGNVVEFILLGLPLPGPPVSRHSTEAVATVDVRLTSQKWNLCQALG